MGIEAAGDVSASLLERTLRHDRVLVAAGLLVVSVASWAWIVPMAHDMYGPMTGSSAWMMTLQWDAPRLLALWAMWAVMMAAMMLPAASSTLLMYTRIARTRGEDRGPVLDAYVFAAGYLAIWAIFSVGATALQRTLSALVLLSPMMEPVSDVFAAGVLAAAGAYQFTPLKYRCLRSCRSPLSFLMTGWRPGRTGAFRMGLAHGAFCLGCCWALMMLLFVAGVMNLYAIVALTILVLVEKAAPAGWHADRVTGVLLIGAAVWQLAA
jgi:predicted metal-binding membrane protein